MTERTLPGIGLTGFWDQGAPWKVGGDQNWLRSSVLTQLAVESATTSLPASPLNGVIYIVPVGDPNANQVAARDNGAWVYLPPSEGWTAYVRDTGVLMNFDGTDWVPSTTPLAAALAASGGAGMVGDEFWFPTPYLATVSKLNQGRRISIYAFLPDAEIPNFRNGTSTFLVESKLEEPLSLGVNLEVPAGVYPVSPSLVTAAVTNEYAANKVCLPIRSKVKITGEGTFRLAPGAWGTGGTIFGNPDGAIDDLVIEGITVDGGALDGASGGMSAVHLVGVRRALLRRLIAKNAPASGASGGLGIAIRSSAGTRIPEDCIIESCWALNAGYIGVQIDRIQGLMVNGVYINTTVDNGLDIYGNDGAGGQFNPGQTKRIVVNGLVAKSIGLTGAFLESTGNIAMSNFDIEEFGTNGIFMNRINSGSLNNILSHGRIKNTGGVGVGMKFKNTVGQSSVRGVMFEELEYSWWMEGGQYVDLQPCYHRGIAKEIVHMTKSTNRFYRSLLKEQVIQDPIDSTTLLPQLHSPNDNPMNTPNRIGLSEINAAHVLHSNTKTVQNYTRKTVNLQTFPSTSVYSQYVSSETQVYLSGANEPTLGDYALIAGVAWQFLARPSTSVWQVRKWTGAAFDAGDYTAELNSALSVQVKAPTWITG